MSASRSFALIFTVLIGASAAAQATQTGSLLTITTTNLEDSFKVVSGPAVGVVQLFGVVGIADGTTFSGVANVHVNTLAGLDKVQFESFSAAPPGIRIDTGSGDSEVDIDLKVPATTGVVTSSILVIGGSGNDKVIIETDSDANGFASDWDIQSGGGLNDSLVLFQSDDPRLSTAIDLNVTGGNDLDKVLLEIGTKSTNLSVALGGNLGDGFNDCLLKAKGAGAGSASLSTSLTTGNSLDKVLVEFSEVGTVNWSGALNTGAGGDEIGLGFPNDLAGNWVVNTGSENDKVTCLAKGMVAGSPTINLGVGDDLVEFLAFGLAAGAAPLSDGGPGYDIFKGVGVAVNFEIVN